MIPYISPDYRVQIGKYEVKKLHKFYVVSDRRKPFDLAELEIPQPFQKILDDDAVKITYGYRGGESWDVFSGVTTNISSTKVKRIFAKDMMLKLQATVSQTFLDVVPQDIISFCLSKVGVSSYQLSSEQFQKKRKFVVFNKTIIQVLKLITETWELDDEWSFYFNPDESFFWGKWDESPRSASPVIQLETGKNIIDLKPGTHTGTLKTIILPIQHSQKLKLVDHRYWQNDVLVRVEKVEIQQQESKGRMMIEWKIIRS